MNNQARLWDARCLLCGLVVGQVVEASFVHDPNCSLPLRISGGHLRCCRCGGSLLKEPATLLQTETLTVDQARSHNQSKYRAH